jgi:hypothetical protein
LEEIRKDEVCISAGTHILYKYFGIGGKGIMHRIYRTDSRHISWLYLFLGGFLLGVFMINIWRGLFLKDMELLNAASLSRLRYLEVDGGSFFLYVLKERMGMVILMCLLATTYVGTYAVSIFALWAGTMAGVFLSVASIRYGMKGIALVLAGILPQYLLLVPACIMLMNWCYKICTALYHPEKSLDIRYGTKKQYLMQKAVQLLVIIGVVIVGSAVESYVNPVLLSGFLKMF